MSEISSNKISTFDQQRILITGVSGLVGRILFNYLTEKYSEKYEIFGLDKHTNISSRYQADHSNDIQVNHILPLRLDKFIQCDITDRMKFHKIVEEHHIDIIIHLAALLETHSNIQAISFVNIEGTKNVFETPNVRRIIYVSSVRTVFGYLEREPYRSIRNGTFDDETMLTNLRKLTATDDPPLSDLEPLANVVYCQSKIIGEQMALEMIKNHSISIITVRLGWVNIDDQPGTTWLRTVWLSHRDLCSFFDRVIHAPLNISGIYFALSKNHRSWIDINDAQTDLHFIPEDGAEKL